MKKSLIAGMLIAFGFVGCTTTTNCCPSTITQQTSNVTPTNLVSQNNTECFITNPTSFNQCTCSHCILRIEVKGVGTTPTNALTTAQAKLMARRAAILDGYRALAEKIYGIRVNSRDTVKNMILQNSSLRGYVDGLIRGATIEEEDFKDGIYTVVMSLKLDLNEWNAFLKSNYNTTIYDY